jgi:hypothetical protein
LLTEVAGMLNGFKLVSAHGVEENGYVEIVMSVDSTFFY